MPDEVSERTRWINGFRWCPVSEMVQPWIEGEVEEEGCDWCTHGVSLDSFGPHLKLVLARAADESYSAYERLRDHVNTLSYAEMGEPESVVAGMWAYYTAAAKSKTLNGQLTNLVRGLAQTALIAVANGRWARTEHTQALALRDALRKSLIHHNHGPGLCEGCDNALAVVDAVLLEDKPPEPPFAVNLDLPVPDPAPESSEPAPEAPEGAVDRVEKMHESGHHHECAGPCNPAYLPTVEDLVGSDPGFTGRLSAEDYVRQGRDDPDEDMHRA